MILWSWLFLDFGIAKKYIDDLSANVKRGNRAKLERGEWPNQAPLGYRNNTATKCVEVDERIAPFIKRIFELYASGIYTLKQAADLLYKEGFMTKSGTKVRKSQLHRIIQKKFYLGLMERDGKLYPAKHPPIISQELFERANDVMHGRLHPKPKKNFFHLRGFLKCGTCGCVLTATKKKGHDYYYCTNGKGNCEEHKSYLRSERLDEIVADAFSKFEFDEELVEIAYEAAKQKMANTQGVAESARESLKKELNSLSERQSRLVDAFVAGTMEQALYEQKMTQLTNAKVILESQLKRIEGKGEFTLEPVKQVFLSAKYARSRYLASNVEQKREIVGNLLWNLTIQNQKPLSYQFKTPFNILAEKGKITDLNEMLRLWDVIRTVLIS